MTRITATARICSVVKQPLVRTLFCNQWIADDQNVLTLIIGDATFPAYKVKEDGVLTTGDTDFATGGGTYQVALQQARFQMDAGREDRWICQMQFVAMSRRDVVPRVF